MQRIQGERKGISDLVSPPMDTKLINLLGNYMERGVKIKKIRGSDALGAAKIYADRRYPILRQDAPKPAFQFVKVDISIYNNPDPDDNIAQGNDLPANV